MASDVNQTSVGFADGRSAAPGPPLRDPLAKWLKAWGGVVVLAVLNGAIHRGYEPFLGELPAHQVSGLVLLVLVFGWATRVQRRHPLVNARQALAVGAVWALLTVTFEFTFFHYVGGTPWQTLQHDYDLGDGRVWAVVVAGIAVIPWLATKVLVGGSTSTWQSTGPGFV